MAQIETWLKQDIKNPVKVKHLTGNVFSADNLGNLIGVEVYNDGAELPLSGTVSGSVIRADGGTVALTGSISGNKASVVLTQACYAVPGAISVIIKLTTGSTVTTIGAVVGTVYRTTTGTIIDPGTIIPSVAEMINQIQNAIDSIPPDYSALVGQVDDLKSALNGAYNFDLVSITETNKSINTQGATVAMSDGVPQADVASGYNYRLVNCENYEYACFTGQGGTTSRLYAFVDASGNILKKSGQGAVAVFQKEKVPQNAKWFILNTKINTESIACLYIAYDEKIKESNDRILELRDDTAIGWAAIKPSNILIGVACYDNIGMSSVDGTLSENNDFWITDYIKIDDVAKAFTDTEIYKICFFDKNKTFLRMLANKTDFAIGNDVGYIRLQYLHAAVPYAERRNVGVYLNVSKYTYAYEVDSDDVFVESSGSDIVDYADGVKYAYLNENDEITFSINWKMYIFKTDTINRITLVNGYTNRPSTKQVAFYGSGGISDDNFISGIPFDNSGIMPSQLKNIQIPANAAYCAILNRTTSGDVQIIGTINNGFKPRSKYNLLGIAIKDTGEIFPNDDYWITDYISADENKRKIISKYPIYKVVCFDENQTAVGRIRVNGGRSTNILNGSAYFRVQFETSLADFYDNDNYLVCVQEGHEENPQIIFGTLNSYVADYALKTAMKANHNSLSYQGEKIDLGNTFEYSRLSYSANGQDACWYNNILFAFSSTGYCKVVNTVTGETVTTFAIDKHSTIQPHCNTAVFSNTFYESSDLFPLMYVNAYNTAGLPRGTCYVHRVMTDENNMPTGTTLVQTITIGFTDVEPWTSGNDIRPYGNFFVDTDNGYLYTYTLKDDIGTTRFFKFNVPSLDNTTVTLTITDIIDQFDVPYMPYIQGNTYHNGRAYILNGYGNTEYPPYLNVVDLSSKQLVTRLNFIDTAGLSIEPEFINIHDGVIVTGQTTAYSLKF